MHIEAAQNTSRQVRSLAVLNAFSRKFPMQCCTFNVNIVVKLGADALAFSNDNGYYLCLHSNVLSTMKNSSSYLHMGTSPNAL